MLSTRPDTDTHLYLGSCTPPMLCLPSFPPHAHQADHSAYAQGGGCSMVEGVPLAKVRILGRPQAAAPLHESQGTLRAPESSQVSVFSPVEPVPAWPLAWDGAWLAGGLRGVEEIVAGRGDETAGGNETGEAEQQARRRQEGKAACYSSPMPAASPLHTQLT